MLAALFEAPEFVLDEAAPAEEHIKLARAIERVARCYDIPHMSEKTYAWMMLAKTAGYMYTPRIIALYMRMRAERAKPVIGARPPSAPPQPAAGPTITPSAGPAAPPRQPAPPSQGAPGTPGDDLVRTVTIPGLEHMGSVTVRLNS